MVYINRLLKTTVFFIILLVLAIAYNFLSTYLSRENMLSIWVTASIIAGVVGFVITGDGNKATATMLLSAFSALVLFIVGFALYEIGTLIWINLLPPGFRG